MPQRIPPPVGHLDKRENFGNNVPINPSQMPIAKKRFSDFILAQMQTTVSGENPEQAAPHYQQGKQVMWNSFVDYSMKNPHAFPDTLYLYMGDIQSWIYQFFPIKLDAVTTVFIQEQMEVLQEMPYIGTRKVPFRNISATVTARKGHALLSKQGFSMDRSFLKSPDGMVVFDRLVDSVAANLWTFVQYNSFAELLFQPSSFRKAENLYPFVDVPQTVTQLFEYEHNNMFILNKNPFGFHVLRANADRIFGQRQKECNGIMCAKDDLFYAGNNPLEIYYDAAGPVSVNNRNNIGEEKSVDGAKLYPVPLMMGRVHDTFFEPILQSTIQLGSRFRFLEPCQSLKAADYTSDKRSTKWSSSTRNGMTKYSLMDALSHAVEFIPMDNRRGSEEVDYECDDLHGIEPDNPSNPRGQLNRDLLNLLINNRMDVFRGMRTKLEGNENFLNQFILYNQERRGRSGASSSVYADNQRFYIANMIGEISERNCKTKYLDLPARTLERNMCEGLSQEDIVRLERGLRLAKELNACTDSTKISEVLNCVDATKASRATANLAHRESTSLEDDDLGIAMLTPNVYGGPTFDARKMAAARNMMPYGLGHISGFLTVLDESIKHPDAFNGEAVQIIRECVDVYMTMFDNLDASLVNNSATSPKLVPIHHNNPHMTDRMRSLIVMWYTLVTHFSTPNLFTITSSSGSAFSKKPATSSGASVLDGLTLADRVFIFNYLRVFDPAFSESPLDRESFDELAKRPANGITQEQIAAHTNYVYKKDDAKLLELYSAITGVNAKKAHQKARYEGAVDKINEIFNKIDSELDALAARVKKISLASDMATFASLMATKVGSALKYEEWKNLVLLFSANKDALSRMAGACKVGSAATGSTFLSQFAFDFPGEKLNAGKINVSLSKPTLVPVADESAPARFRHAIGASDKCDADSIFEKTDGHMFGGTLFCALPFVHPQLPLLERSGFIADSLRNRQDIGRVNVNSNRRVRFRNITPNNKDATLLVSKKLEDYDAQVYTEEFYASIAQHPLLKLYPNSITHMFANPLVYHANPECSDFEARIIASHSMMLSAGIATRAVLYSQITLQQLNAWFVNNVAIPLGVDAIRAFETQLARSAIAVTGEQIGFCNFSGFQNTIGAATLNEHYNFQTMVTTKTMVSDNTTYTFLPLIRGETILHGKGHEFINHFSSQPIQELEEVVNAVNSNNLESLGSRSIIAVTSSYNRSIERDETRDFDLRNTYRREDFASRLHHSRDFVDEKPTLAYAGAPVLNALFKGWDRDVSVPLEDRSFHQIMNQRAVNFHILDNQQEVWDPVTGWTLQKGLHPWSELEVQNCARMQQSQTSVVQAIPVSYRK